MKKIIWYSGFAAGAVTAAIVVSLLGQAEAGDAVLSKTNKGFITSTQANTYLNSFITAKGPTGMDTLTSLQVVTCNDGSTDGYCYSIRGLDTDTPSNALDTIADASTDPNKDAQIVGKVE
jgi:hypothetical protein